MVCKRPNLLYFVAFLSVPVESNFRFDNFGMFVINYSMISLSMLELTSKKNYFSATSCFGLQITNRPSFSAQMGAQGPSLGYPDPNSMLSPNMVSVLSGRVGVVRFGALPEIRVWVRNSRIRVARTNLIADLDSTKNVGSYRVFCGRY